MDECKPLYLGAEHTAGGGGFVNSARLPKPPAPTKFKTPEKEMGRAGFAGGRVGSDRNGSPPKNSGFMGVRAKGERLVGGGFSAASPPTESRLSPLLGTGAEGAGGSIVLETKVEPSSK